MTAPWWIPLVDIAVDAIKQIVEIALIKEDIKVMDMLTRERTIAGIRSRYSKDMKTFDDEVSIG